ncbi:hypothetical protein QVD99_001005 [Batrachochytrium dendrobatidis]|nr:hypothetical protein O5D80_008662 [Batrachochytrium dendrobatidis]KAK5673563.1 hypothetical protein QVD99_001005 [Batrachochytrium dendrobatidis]
MPSALTFQRPAAVALWPPITKAAVFSQSSFSALQSQHLRLSYSYAFTHTRPSLTRWLTSWFIPRTLHYAVKPTGVLLTSHPRHLSLPNWLHRSWWLGDKPKYDCPLPAVDYYSLSDRAYPFTLRTAAQDSLVRDRATAARPNLPTRSVSSATFLNSNMSLIIPLAQIQPIPTPLPRHLTPIINSSKPTPKKPSLFPSGAQLRKDLKVVIVMGGPGSGKGVQCTHLLENFNVVHVSTGQLIREALEAATAAAKLDSQIATVPAPSKLSTANTKPNVDTPTSYPVSPTPMDSPTTHSATKKAAEARRQVIENCVAAGVLVPNEIVMELLCGFFINLDKNVKGVLLDGYPRTLEQAEDYVEKIGVPHTVLALQCPDAILTSRLLRRKRLDDALPAIRQRLQHYRVTMPELIRFYLAIGARTFRIPAYLHREAVSKAILPHMQGIFEPKCEPGNRILGNNGSASVSNVSNTVTSNPTA